MTYTEIITLALAYADRQKDPEVSGNIDNFLRIVESRLNYKLKIQKMAARATLNTVENQLYYGLPSDFAGIRDIEIREANDSLAVTTMVYCNPEQMNRMIGLSSDIYYYTIIADQLQISQSPDSHVLEIVYYRKVPNLNTNDNVNWVSEEYPDLYVFGLQVEINSFIKDAEAATLWDTRFKEKLDEIINDDQITRWSGTSLVIKNG